MVASPAGRTPPGVSADPCSETRRRGSAVPGPAGDADSATAVEISPLRREACAGLDVSAGRGGCEADTARVERRRRRSRLRRSQYVGNTPLDTSEVTPGRHQVSVSADGYDGASESVNVAESGSTELHVSLKTVRLDVSVPVVHKHAMGSCEGTLRADPGGLRYETANTADAFSLPLSDLEVFSTDYAQKTLKVKKRGGKTWNFTTKAPNADPLVAFQQAVDHARQKLGPAK